MPVTSSDLYAALRKEHRKMIALMAQIISLSDRAQAVAALEEFKGVLREHERVERSALYPLLGVDSLPPDIAVAHAAVHEALRDIEATDAEAAEWWYGVARLRHSVERHIAEEEAALRVVMRPGANATTPRGANAPL